MSPRETPERPGIGVGPMLWIAVLILFGVVMAVILLVSAWVITTEPTTPDELVRWGLVPGEEPILAYADLSEQADLSDGCLLTNQRAVQWEDRHVVASVPLAGTSVQIQGSEVVIGGAAVCRFAEPGPARLFAARAARLADPPRG